MLILYITDSWMLCSVSWWCWSCLVHMINYFECDLWSANNFNVLRVVFSKQHILFNWKDAFSIVYVSPGSAKSLFRWGGKINHILIAKSLSNDLSKITKIMLKLQLKMSNPFSESQCTIDCLKTLTCNFFII